MQINNHFNFIPNVGLGKIELRSSLKNLYDFPFENYRPTEVIQDSELFWKGACHFLQETEAFAYLGKANSQFPHSQGNILKKIIEFFRQEICSEFDQKREVFLVLGHWCHQMNCGRMTDRNAKPFINKDLEMPVIYFSEIQEIASALGKFFSHLFDEVKIEETEACCDVDLGYKCISKTIPCICFHIMFNHRYLKVLERDQNELATKIYDLYTEQKGCDFSLIVNHQTIGIHQLIFRIYGGVIGEIFDQSMGESLEKSIDLNHFSEATVLAFIDFVYLGKNGLQVHTIDNRGVDLADLFKMAHMYQVEELQNWSIHLMKECWTSENYSEAFELAVIYDETPYLAYLLEDLSEH